MQHANITLHFFMLITLSSLILNKVQVRKKLSVKKVCMCECVGKNKLGLKGWHLDLSSFNFSFFLIGHVHLGKKRSVMKMHPLKVNVFWMTLREYGSFTLVGRTYPALRKCVFIPTLMLQLPSPFPLLSKYHLSIVVVLFYTLSKLFCFIVDFLTSNKVINQTKNCLVLRLFLTPRNSLSECHTLILTLDVSNPVCSLTLLSLGCTH